MSSRKRENGQSVVWDRLLGPRMAMVADRGDSSVETYSGKGSSLSQCERSKGRRDNFLEMQAGVYIRQSQEGGMLGNLPHR